MGCRLPSNATSTNKASCMLTTDAKKVMNEGMSLMRKSYEKKTFFETFRIREPMNDKSVCETSLRASPVMCVFV